MLGIFDSGFGGLTVLKAIHKQLPELSTLYLGDNARAPYGVRSQEEIYQYTLEGVRFLFDRGCPLVILACNTASSQALRRIQQDVLPVEFPDRRALGVIRPAAEHLANTSKSVGIFATPATVQSEAYTHELQHLDKTIDVHQIACPGLTDLIEAGRHEGEDCAQLVKHFVDELVEAAPDIDTALLGCTHYPLVETLFRAHLPKDVTLVSQGELVATALAEYLTHHPEFRDRIQTSGEHTYVTTGKNLNDLASRFYGQETDIWEEIDTLKGS